MNDGFFVQVTRATIALVATHGGIFGSVGMAMFRSIVVILLVYEGFRITFGDQPPNRIAGLLLQIAIVYSALVYYNAPFPGVGKNLTQIITGAGADLAQTIDTSNEEAAGAAMANYLGSASGTSWSFVTQPVGMFRYFIFFFCIAALQVAMLGIIGFGFAAAGCLVLIGPVLIPFFLVPGLDWIARGWFRSLIQFSGYPMFGAAFIYIYGRVFMNFSAQIGPNIDATVIATYLTQAVILSITCVFGILKVPSLVATVFSGSSGVSSFPGYRWWR